MPISRNRMEIVSAACFVLFAVLTFTVSTVAGAPALALGVLFSVRARSLARAGAADHSQER
ncbi:MAG TPA: hypothetical protein VHY83_13155 [Solirubrobacteraceae bacterium]|jgi:hypothetical protein|nr:hypothetical protein [Solirubrobacteraceae bacterium]